MASTTTTFIHPTIGSVKANTTQDDGVATFLGLQYATLADRFAPPVMREYGKDETVDATKLGPQVLSPAPNADPEFALIQHELEYDRSALTQSDTQSLCLNITVPTSAAGSIDVSAKLPVFVFIHGGGFTVGSGMYPQYDMARLVRLSIAEGNPLIGVSINYRTGAPGFLTSSQMRKAGYKANNGLRDQRTALLWIRKHIAGFGGDGENITLMGESAGGISACYHLFSEEPLFKRMMVMSGTMLLIPPMSREAADSNYTRAVKALGLEGENESNAVERMIKMDGQDLVGKLTSAGTAYVPVLDDEIVPTELTFHGITNDQVSIPGQKWCEAAIIGDCQFDGNIQSLRLMHRKTDIAPAFCTSITASLEPTIAAKLLSAYALTPLTEDDEALFKILQIANDLGFYIPTLALRQNLAAHMQTFVYRFNEPNPWEGAWQGHATHILDLTFLLQNFNEFLGNAQRRVAEGFGRAVVGFVSGGEPWGAEGARVMGPGGKVQVVDEAVPRDVGRRGIMFDLARELEGVQGEKSLSALSGGLDKLNEAFNAFMLAV